MAAVKPLYGVGLDAGSRKTRIVICALEGGRVRVGVVKLTMVPRLVPLESPPTGPFSPRLR